MKIKYSIPMIVVLALSMALSGCSGMVANSQAQVGKVMLYAMANSDTVATPDPADAPLSLMQIGIGILTLKDTSNAITAAQAAELLPLWQKIQTQQEEMEANAGQKPDQADTSAGNGQPPLQRQSPSGDDQGPDGKGGNSQVDAMTAILTSDQITAIKALDLSSDTLTTTLSGLGITLPTPDPSLTLTPRPTMASGEKPSGGQGGPGGNGGQQGAGGPGGQPGGGDKMDGQGGGPGGMGGFAPAELIDAVVAYLETLTA